MNIKLFVFAVFIENGIAEPSPQYFSSHGNSIEGNPASTDFGQLPYDANPNASPYIGKALNGNNLAFTVSPHEISGLFQRSFQLSDYDQQYDKPEIGTRLLGDLGYSLWNMMLPKNRGILRMRKYYRMQENVKRQGAILRDSNIPTPKVNRRRHHQDDQPSSP